MRNIQPCPHCGEQEDPTQRYPFNGVRVYRETPCVDAKPTDRVVCMACGSSSPSIAVWNKRKHTIKKDLVIL